MQYWQFQAGRDPKQQIRAGLGGPGEDVVAVEAAVEGDQHPLVQVGQHRLREFAFAGADRAELGGDHGVRAALTQPHDADLRERTTLRLPGGWAAKSSLVFWCVGHVEGDAVDGHQPPSSLPGADRRRRGQRNRGAFE